MRVGMDNGMSGLHGEEREREREREGSTDGFIDAIVLPMLSFSK